MVDSTEGTQGPNTGNAEETAKSNETDKAYVVPKELQSWFKDQLEGVMKGPSKRIKELEAQLASANKQETTPSKKLDDQPLVQQLKAEIDQMKADKVRDNARNLEGFIREACAAENLNSETLPLLMPFLKQHVAYDDSGNPVWKDDDLEVNLRTGINSFVKTNPAAKHFLAATGAKGSGGTSIDPTPSKTPAKTSEELKKAFFK